MIPTDHPTRREALAPAQESMLPTARVVVRVEDAMREMEAFVREGLTSRVRSARAQMTASGRAVKPPLPPQPAVESSNWLASDGGALRFG